MEKIYMEESKKKKRSVFDFSVVLSFAVAIFAVFSLIAVGFNKTSYAAPVTGDSFTFHTGKSTGDRPLQVTGWQINASDEKISGTDFTVSLYYSDASYTNPVYCIEANNTDIDDNIVYNKESKIEDYGLLYLLSKSNANGNSIITNSNSNKYIEAWATQVAIWVYMSEKYPENNMHKLNATKLSNIKSAKYFTVQSSDNINSQYDVIFNENVYTKYIEPLVKEALNVNSIRQVTVSKDEGEIAKTSDGKFYQTTLITVMGNPASDFINYDINLTGIDGAIAVDENGNTLENKNVSAGQKFYVRIPADKVTESVQTLNIGVTGHFNVLTGYIYSSGAKQKVVSVYGGVEDASSGLPIEIVGAPDTKMNKVQTIYFIGLVVLLCGVGIIYANAKPVEVEQ